MTSIPALPVSVAPLSFKMEYGFLINVSALPMAVRFLSLVSRYFAGDRITNEDNRQQITHANEDNREQV